MSKLLLSVALVGLVACAGGNKDARPAAVSADASSYSAYGMTIDRPSQWHFVQPDSTVAPDAQVILHGPIGSATLAPTVEVPRGRSYPRRLIAPRTRRTTRHRSLVRFETGHTPA